MAKIKRINSIKQNFSHPRLPRLPIVDNLNTPKSGLLNNSLLKPEIIPRDSSRKAVKVAQMAKFDSVKLT